ALHGPTVLVDGRPALVTIRPPGRWAVTIDGSIARVVTTGNASDAAFVARHDRGARLEAAFLHAVAHRTTLRSAVGLGAGAPTDPSTLPGPAEAARGWSAVRRRGARVDLPDDALQRAVDVALTQVLLAADAWNPDGTAVAALEDWGFDEHARQAWS